MELLRISDLLYFISNPVENLLDTKVVVRPNCLFYVLALLPTWVNKFSNIYFFATVYFNLYFFQLHISLIFLYSSIKSHLNNCFRDIYISSNFIPLNC